MNGAEVVTGATGERAPEPRGARPDALPCLNRNNSTEGPKLTPYARKTAFALTSNIAHLADRYGIERLAFVTLGFADPKPDDPRPDPNKCSKEAQRRLNSLQTHLLRELFTEAICVPERGGKGGRLHFHHVVAQSEDLRTGVDFAALERGDFSTAPKALRRLWAVFRENLESYGFGAWHQIFPVKSTAEGISKYVGKYISKQFAGRRPEDKGMRLVRYTEGTNCHRVRFSWNSPRAKLWRWQVGEFARLNGCSDLDDLGEKLGKRWSYWHRNSIMQLEPPMKVVAVRKGDGDEPPDLITLWDIWNSDRIAVADAVAQAIGATQADVYCGLYQRPQIKMSLEFDVPAWTGEAVPRDDFECGPEPVDTTIVWSDGRVERN